MRVLRIGNEGSDVYLDVSHVLAVGQIVSTPIEPPGYTFALTMALRSEPLWIVISDPHARGFSDQYRDELKEACSRVRQGVVEALWNENLTNIESQWVTSR